MATQPDYSTILQQSQAQQMAAAEPVVGALEAQRTPLTERYSNLIKQLGEQQGLATKNTETQTSRDFGARGISPNSGLFSQTLGERVQPIVSDYTGRISGAAGDRENALAALNSQIAGVQGQYSQQGISNALNLYNTQYGEYQNQVNREAQQAEAERQRQFQAQQNQLSQKSSGSGSGSTGATTSQKIGQFNSTIQSFINAKDQNGLYEFLRAGGTYQKQTGLSGADVARALGLDPEQYWAKWRALDAQIKATPSKTSAADQYFKTRLGG